MAVSKTISMRFSRADLKALRELSTIMQRNQSDVLRVLVHSTLAAYREQDAAASTSSQITAKITRQRDALREQTTKEVQL